jgi:hypothetical protein
MAGYVVCYTDDDGYREVVDSFTEPRDAHTLNSLGWVCLFVGRVRSVRVMFLPTIPYAPTAASTRTKNEWMGSDRH